MANSPFDRLEIERARAHLEQLGYRIELRHDGWWECRVSTRDEDWVGRGSDADEAFAQALASAFPSRASRLALHDVLLSSPRRKPFPSAPPTDIPAATNEEPARQRPSATPEFSLDAPTIELPLVHAPDSDGSVATRVDAPVPKEAPPPAADKTTVEVTILGDSEITRPPTPAGDVLRDLEELRFRVLTIEPEIAVMAPQLQRLHLLGWAARARALEAASPPSPAVDFASGTVVALLGRMARAFWPGSVRALARAATPAACADELQIDKIPSTWSEIALLATETLNALCSGARGLDDYGWSDASSLAPQPADADAMLERVNATCERAERLLDASTTPGTVDVDVVAALADAARRVRWLRCNVGNDVLWGTAIGTLRRILAHHPAGLESVARIVDPSHAPATSWAVLIDESGEPRVETPSTDDTFPLVARVRERVSGRRMLFIGHREDPALRDRLESFFRLSVEWCSADPERVDAQCERVRRGAYDFVLSATGFQTLSADRTVSEACRSADVPFVRVDHARPLACARGLARELGLSNPQKSS